jgi:hypothetical protein
MRFQCILRRETNIPASEYKYTRYAQRDIKNLICRLTYAKEKCMSEKKEYILCAAIYYKDGITHVHQPKNIESGVVICGRRHHNCFSVLSALAGSGNYNKSTVEQGFVTSKDRFVNRTEAGNIAFTSGQIKETTNCLFSEDLY